jgi:hypothetical protein
MKPQITQIHAESNENPLRDYGRRYRHSAAGGILAGLAITAILGTCIAGCTAPSNRMAGDASGRVDALRAGVFMRQNDALKILLFRQTLAKINAAKTDEERGAILNDAWNERDLIGWWGYQEILARCTQYATVDQYIAAQQGIFGLLAKDAARRWQKPLEELDEFLAKKVGEAVAKEGTGVEGAQGGSPKEPGTGNGEQR